MEKWNVQRVRSQRGTKTGSRRQNGKKKDAKYGGGRTGLGLRHPDYGALTSLLIRSELV